LDSVQLIEVTPIKFAIIANPHSGKKESSKILDLVRPVFDSEHSELSILVTAFPGHAEELAGSLDFSIYDGLLVLGGDGTFHEVVNGVLKRADKKTLPIGLLPAGSGNSILHDLSLTDPLVAAKAIIGGRTQFIDVAQIKGDLTLRYSINLIGWGLVTDVGERAETLRWLGPRRYTVSSVIEILRRKTRRANLVLDGKVIVDDFTFVAACNSIHIGKGMKMAPSAKLDDGLIDLVVVRGSINRQRLFSVLPKLFDGSHIEEPEVAYYQVPSFSLSSETKDNLNIDGEMVGTTPIDVEILKQVIEIFV
jgi:YegS/Rv2252/BmrU family lipid kinase